MKDVQEVKELAVKFHCSRSSIKQDDSPEVQTCAEFYSSLKFQWN